ncbi:MAG: DUF2853 family protein [Methylocella sp.]
MTDHLADVKKYAKKPVNEAALAAMEKTYRLVLSQPDSKYVACSDPAERETVRENFLKKKLGRGDEFGVWGILARIFP